MSRVIINIALMILCNFVLHAGCQNITLCSDPVKGGPCSLTCSTPDSNEDVKFYLGSVEKGNCIGGTGICSGVSQSGSVTTLTISSLSRSAHEGSWTCSYKNLQSSSKTLQVYTEPSVTEFINVSSTTPSSNEFKTVNLAARSYCFFPSVPTAELYYNDTKSSTKVSDYSVVGVPSSKCETYELDLQVNATVSKNQLSGKTVYFYFQFTSALGTTYRTTNDLGPYTFEVETTSGESSTTTESAINLSTDVGTSANSDTSKNSTESSTTTLSSVTFSDKSTLEGNTLSGSTESVNTKSETTTAPVTASPSGMCEEMIIVISVSSSVGGILLIVVIITVVLCKRKSGTEKRENHKKKHGIFHIKNGNNKDLNSNYDQVQNNEYSTKSRRNFQGDTNFYKKNPQYITYGDRIPTGVEYPRSKSYHQQKYFPKNQHHYRNQNSPYYYPYTEPRNVMYHQRYPGSGYNEDMLGYSRGGPYRMQQFYLQSYPRQDRYTDDGLERRIGHRRGEYEGYWDNDTLY